MLRRTVCRPNHRPANSTRIAPRITASDERTDDRFGLAVIDSFTRRSWLARDRKGERLGLSVKF